MSVTIEALEFQRDNAKEAIERQEMAMKLAKNVQFRKLILEEFCVQECARYAQMSADPQLSVSDRADALAISQAAGHLRRWLQVVNKMGDVAKDTLSDIERELDDARAEEDVVVDME